MSSASVDSDIKIREGEDTFAGADGNELYMHWWLPQDCQHFVAIAHGAGEHCGRYTHAVHALNKAGYGVYAYDHRGHGRSAGKRVHVGRFDEYLADLNKFLEEVKEREKEGKIFLWGHSMGGLIVSLYAIQYRPTLWGVVLTAPAYKLAVEVPALKIMAARVLSNVVPGLTLPNEVDPEALSTDPQVGKDYVADELVCQKASVRWGAEFLDAVDRGNARAREFKLPVLIAHGKGDRIAAWEGSESFLNASASDDKTLKVYDGFYHELHNEVPEKREQFFADLIEWLNTRAKS